MTPLELSIDEVERRFVFSGDISLIARNYRAKSFFFDVLRATVAADGSMVVPYSGEDREILLKKIEEALEKYGIPKTDSKRIETVLEGYYAAREGFREFGAKAKAIWNNDLDAAELRAFKEVIEAALPGRRLYDRQLLAAFHLAFSQNACNFSVPGSGKTTIVYAAFAYLHSLSLDSPKRVNKLLVIGPLSSFGPWEDEFVQCFGRRPFSARLSGGVPKAVREQQLLTMEPTDKTPELILMTYQSIAFNLRSLERYLQRRDHRVMVVLDEAHRIKNVEGGVWAQTTLSIAKYAASRVVLTGTPLPNGYEDIYNLFEYVWPGKDIVEFPVYQLKDMSSNRYDNRISQLIENISPFFVRIRKSHLNLPPVVNHPPIRVQMGPVQQSIYSHIERKYIPFFAENGAGTSLSSRLAKARFVRLMQAATNPGLLRRPLDEFFRDQGLGDEIFIDDAALMRSILQYPELEAPPEKFRVAKELIQELLNAGEKVVVWATFIQNTKEFQAYLASSGIESQLLIGEIPVERDDVPMDDILTREKIIWEFHQPDSAFRVLIANPFAVSESISLHKACHHAIYLERTFNATHFIQSKDRIHRVGLEPGTLTHYHYMLSVNSIDETIHSRLNEKEQRMLELIESAEIPLFSENMDYDIDLDDDVKAIIRDYVRRTTQAQ